MHDVRQLGAGGGGGAATWRQVGHLDAAIEGQQVVLALRAEVRAKGLQPLGGRRLLLLLLLRRRRGAATAAAAAAAGGCVCCCRLLHA